MFRSFIAVKEIDYPLDGVECFQLLSAAIAFISFCFTIYFLFKSHFGYKYGYIATSQEIKSYQDQLIDFYITEKVDLELAKNRAEEETLEYIDSEYAKYTDMNARNNDSKASYLHKSNISLIFSVISTIAIGLPYAFHEIISSSETYKVEITNLKELTMPAPNNNQPTSPSPSPSPTPQPSPQPSTPTVKPSPPPGRLITESYDPAKKK